MGSLESVGDPARRASNRLLAAGLDRDIQGKPSLALGQYERALQVDPTNPYAYLVLARHHADVGDAELSAAGAADECREHTSVLLTNDRGDRFGGAQIPISMMRLSTMLQCARRSQ